MECARRKRSEGGILLSVHVWDEDSRATWGNILSMASNRDERRVAWFLF
jgi:hypothetical protein